MTLTASYLCIGCPLGCRLEVEEDEGHQIVEIRGFSCKRGKEYAAQEHISPQRMVTTTVGVMGGSSTRLPVKTRTPVAKALTLAVCQALRTVRVAAPVALGDVIVPNVLGTGVDVVATRTIPSAAGSVTD
jgi:CxxC motif-containing protein